MYIKNMINFSAELSESNELRGSLNKKQIN